MSASRMHASSLLTSLLPSSSDNCVWLHASCFWLLAESESESESYVTTDNQSASLSWNKALIWGLRPDFYYRQTVAGSLIWGALSDERTGLSFTITAGPSQRSLSRVRAPWDSQPYFTVSDLRLPSSLPPTTRRVTVEVFDPPSTWVWLKSWLLASGFWTGLYLYLLGGWGSRHLFEQFWFSFPW
jgi:hypothetical protein